MRAITPRDSAANTNSLRWRRVEASEKSRSSTTISGRSATGAVARPGFERLVAWLCAGEIGGRAVLRSLPPRAQRARLASPARASLGVTASPDNTAASTRALVGAAAGADRATAAVGVIDAGKQGRADSRRARG